jgi:crotonobetainyl-CoA:carnitine CoA-transferase CaiB-like acyl-CoA transferase
MAEFGAEAIKVEMPGQGDPCRQLGDKYNGVGLMWAQENRNKKGITCDLRTPGGQEIIKELVKRSDVLVQNFRPGTMERWNLGYEVLEETNPGLVMVSISAYGQTGPYRHKAGFGRVAQAFGGLTYLAGYPDRAPVNPGSATIADYLAGLFAAFSTMVALENRHRTGKGQHIDISLYEGIFRIMDNLTSAYDKLGLVRERMGTGTAHTVPHNHYPTEDGKWVAIACTSDRIFQRLAKAMGREELAEDPRYQTGPERVKRREEVDGMVSEWTQTFDMNALTELLDSEEVPVSPINSIADIFQNPQYEARGSIVEVDDPVVGRVKMPGVVPRMSQSPGSRPPGPWPGAAQRGDILRAFGVQPGEAGGPQGRGGRLTPRALPSPRPLLGGVRKVPSPLVTLDANRILQGEIRLVS